MGDEGLELNESHAVKTILSESGGPAGGPIDPVSTKYIRFCEQLRAAGFTAGQLQTIAAAFTDNGLQIVAADPTSK